jgi:hypothetical protein
MLSGTLVLSSQPYLWIKQGFPEGAVTIMLCNRPSTPPPSSAVMGEEEAETQKEGG